MKLGDLSPDLEPSRPNVHQPRRVWQGRGLVARAIIALIREYQGRASPGLRAACRFAPSCSEYAMQAVDKYGALAGSRRALKRFLRCRPPNGGIDEP